MPTNSGRTPDTRKGRASRPDGAATRQHLLDVAGRIFAERGFAESTSKAICETAGTPMASVNYHFGSREALYEAALIEAHRQVVGLDELAALVDGISDPQDRLRTVLTRLVSLSTSTKRPWGFLLILREVLSPSAAIPAFVEQAVRPKAAFMLGIVSDVLGLKPNDAAVQRAVLFTVLPCIAMMIAPRKIQSAVLPAAGSDHEAIVDDYVEFVIAGLEALANAHRAGKPSQAVEAVRRRRTRKKAGA
ncbi:TetR family transcriptional regulator [Paraburkholderia unamae]|uniref:TetR/AcrR family transcriptional regulator n=1 Tax=Paraburkholderia unamae TaxID=219649 RepID=UPI000DC414DB|nr:TetR/AcrR family transcriptional regulator [Paraburkholderia unamae]RAR57451.1 TetR family transcriptional regulator [Paraburkholderia unamae]